MIFYESYFELSNEAVVKYAKEISEAYEKEAKKRVDNVQKFKLTVEEILLRYQDLFGAGVPCHVVGFWHFGKLQFSVEVKGDSRNPLVIDDQYAYSFDLLTQMGMFPKYSYSPRNGGNNVVVIPAELKARKNQFLINVLIAVVLAVVCFYGMKLLPANASSFIETGFIKPIFIKMTNIMAEIATPLVFLAVVTGIIGIGDTRSFGKMGQKLLTGMLTTYLFAGILCAIVSSFVYGVGKAAGNGDYGFVSQMVQLVLDIIPDNLVAPFAIDNDLQVITIAVFVGFVLLVLGNKVKIVTQVLTELSDVVYKAMAFVCKCISALIFFGILNVMCNEMSGFENLYKMIILFICCSLATVLFVVLKTYRVARVPFGVLFKKQLPTTLINLTTSSQVSALPSNMECCKHKFGIDERLVNFGLPLGIVVFMPCGAIFISLVAWSLSAMWGIPFDLGQVVKVTFLGIILAIAAPPIPGSALAIMPIVFSACGLPPEAYPIGILMGTVIGYACPLLNGFLLQQELLCAAVKLNACDKEVLKKPEQ